MTFTVPRSKGSFNKIINFESMKFDLPKDQTSIIKVIGVGGGGSNAVNHMFNQGIKGVDFLVCNTDNQALDLSPVPIKIQLGASLTAGRGAGSIPEVGKNAAIENVDEIKDILAKNTNMVFITAGMGGGTGTGAAPVIAKIAKEMGILTVGIVTIPFNFEGRKRKIQAEAGVEEMRQSVDTLVVICNDRLREMYGNLNLSEAFAQADNVLATAAKGIAEIITVTGSINVDFEDVRTVMADSGVAIMGSARAEGEDRAVKAVEQALASPLLNDNDIQGARYVLLNITYGSQEIQMDEVSEITDYIQEEAGLTADVIWGHGFDEGLGDEICVTIIATGFNSNPDTGHQIERTPEKKVMKLEDEAIKTSPVNSPTPEVSKTVADLPEPFLKTSESTSEKEETSQEESIDFSQRTIEFELNKKEKTTSFETTTNNETTEVSNNSFEPYLKTTTPVTSNEEAREEVSNETSNESVVSPEEQQRRANERIAKLKELSMKLRAPSGISDLENEPAYKRRNIELDNTPHSSESEVSRFTLSEEEDEDGEKRGGLRSNNSFLHDNVD